MAHERTITVERAGKHFVESSVKPGEILEGPFDDPDEALARSKQRSNATREDNELFSAIFDLIRRSTPQGK